MWYALAGVLILNDWVSPTLTLIDVAKPWIVESPAPFTCQLLGAVPGWVFSQAMTFTTGGPHGPAASAGTAATPVVNAARAATRAVAATAAVRRRRGRASSPICAAHRSRRDRPMRAEESMTTASTPAHDAPAHPCVGAGFAAGVPTLVGRLRRFERRAHRAGAARESSKCGALATHGAAQNGAERGGTGARGGGASRGLDDHDRFRAGRPVH